YYDPTYPAAIASISRGAGIEPIVAFGKFRGFATFLALSAFYAAGYSLFRNRSLAYVLLGTALTMVFSGQAGHQVTGFYWGLLSPMAHEADFGLGVLILLEIFFAARFIQASRDDRF